jgi:CDP-diacylglycerol--serine O-phosphatidyltransferase
MRVTRAVVPSLFTVLNMFCGFLSVIHASRLEVQAAVWFIALAAAFDALDGMMARLTKSTSDFGVEMDSLSDVVSFGVAPAYLAFKVHLESLGGLGVFVSALPMMFGGLRLARFNVQLVGHDKDHFVGLPIPVSAFTIGAFILTFYDEVTGLRPAAAAALPWMLVALSLLMVSKVKYDSLPGPSKRAFNKEPWKFVLLALAAAAAIVTKGGAVFPLFVLFILLGLLRAAGGSLRQMFRPSRDEPEEENPEPRSADV